MLLIKKYGDHLQIDIPASTVVYGENLVAEMIKAGKPNSNIRGSKLYIKTNGFEDIKGALIVSHGDGCMSVLFAFVVTQQILSNRKRVPFSTAYQSAYLHTTPDQVGLKLHHNFPTTRRE